MNTGLPMSTAEALWAVAGLTLLTILTRGAFFLVDRELPMPLWLTKALRYAPLAALVAVVAPEVLMDQGRLIGHWQDARVFAAIAGGAYFWWRRGILGTILVGMAVLLPLRLGLGW